MNRLLLILLATLLIGCNVDLSSNIKVAENYFVGSIDTSQNRSLYYALDDENGIGRVNGHVTAVGWNSTHIIVEQKNDKVVQFYILEIEKDHKYAEPKESVSGPFNEKEFLKSRITYKIDEDLRFTDRFDS